MTAMEPTPSAMQLVATRTRQAEAITSLRGNLSRLEAPTRKSVIETIPSAASSATGVTRGTRY